MFKALHDRYTAWTNRMDGEADPYVHIEREFDHRAAVKGNPVRQLDPVTMDHDFRELRDSGAFDTSTMVGATARGKRRLTGLADVRGITVPYDPERFRALAAAHAPEGETTATGPDPHAYEETLSDEARAALAEMDAFMAPHFADLDDVVKEAASARWQDGGAVDWGSVQYTRRSGRAAEIAAVQVRAGMDEIRAEPGTHASRKATSLSAHRMVQRALHASDETADTGMFARIVV